MLPLSLLSCCFQYYPFESIQRTYHFMYKGISLIFVGPNEPNDITVIRVIISIEKFVRDSHVWHFRPTYYFAIFKNTLLILITNLSSNVACNSVGFIIYTTYFLQPCVYTSCISYSKNHTPLYLLLLLTHLKRDYFFVYRVPVF